MTHNIVFLNPVLDPNLSVSRTVLGRQVYVDQARRHHDAPDLPTASEEATSPPDIGGGSGLVSPETTSSRTRQHPFGTAVAR
jgi:hypothetical protein